MCWSCCWCCFSSSPCQKCSWRRSTWSWTHQLESKCQCLPRPWIRILPWICSRSCRLRCHRRKQTRFSFHCSIGHRIDRHIGSSWSCFLHWIVNEPSSHFWNCSCHWKLGQSLGKFITVNSLPPENNFWITVRVWKLWSSSKAWLRLIEADSNPRWKTVTHRKSKINIFITIFRSTGLGQSSAVLQPLSFTLSPSLHPNLMFTHQINTDKFKLPTKKR